VPNLSYVFGMIDGVTAVRLREWRGVKPVAGPRGVAISTRLQTTPEDERVLGLVAEHVGGLRRADLAAIGRPEPLDPAMDAAAKRQARRDRLNTRKSALTAESSARWANAIIAGNDAQYRLARDAQVRHAITRLLHYTRRHGIDIIAVEDLDFADARNTGRETMGRGGRGKRFRKTVAGIPTAVFRNRFAAQTYRHGLRLFAVNPAYTSAWGDQQWRSPYENVTRHEAAATVIGRRAQGFLARRREGVTRTRPEDRVVRATDQAAPDDRQVSTRNRHRPGIRGTESCPPSRASTRYLGRATVTPALANAGQLHQLRL
jgi:hypothetical protein